MTWLQLADYIRAMTPEEKLQPVRLCEISLAHPVMCWEAQADRLKEDMASDDLSRQGSGIAKRGELYLW